MKLSDNRKNSIKELKSNLLCSLGSIFMGVGMLTIFGEQNNEIVLAAVAPFIIYTFKSLVNVVDFIKGYK